MNIGIAIIGLPQSGKTTVFNALTRGQSDISSHKSTGASNLGVAKVPDPRLDSLVKMFQPERTTPAEVQYIDIPSSTENKASDRGVNSKTLNTLQQSDAILFVIRAFNSPSVHHPEGTVDPYRDLTSLQFEMAFSDLAILERREERLEKDIKAAKAGDRDKIERDRSLITKIKNDLMSDIPIREQNLSPDQHRSIRDYQFLTEKPLLVLFNVDEDQLITIDTLQKNMADHIDRIGIISTAICGKLEMELVQMNIEDEILFRDSMDAGESGAERMIRLSYSLLGLNCFFTVGADEVKAWTITENEPASLAAKRIHSDIERGFIRAEVTSFDDLACCGSLNEARKQGLLRSEGRNYPVRDGDIINFLFNV